MIHAYSDEFVDCAMENLGTAVDYGLNYCDLSSEEFSKRFLESPYADLFGTGSPWVVAGMSGVELVMRIMVRMIPDWKAPEPNFPSHYLSEEYWAGWALSQYQWYCARSFKDILTRVPLSEIIAMYRPYHEMDISHFIIEMDRRYHERIGETNLKKIRTRRGLSQNELSQKSEVNLRSIQMYEQRVNSIDKAQAQTLYRLAHVLGCTMEELLEDPLFEGEAILDV